MRLTTELQVDLAKLQENFSLIRESCPRNEIIYMVKANAYGHGMLTMSRAAADKSEIKNFGVASLGEALSLKTEISSKEQKIIVFSDPNLELSQADIYSDGNVIPVISNLADLEMVLTQSQFKKLPLYLKFNTGMNRLGIHWQEVEKTISLLKKYQRTSIEHLMTHFASSYIPKKDGDRTQRQYELFKDIKKHIAAAGISINETSVANSGAIEQGIGLEESHIRPGLMVYGAKSFEASPWAGHCLSKLKTSVLKIDPVKKGTPIGYGAHVCHEDGQLVYLPIGYGDGVLTYYSGKDINWHGKLGRILGRVNMDLTAIFFKELPPGLSTGDDFYFWDGRLQQISELSHQFKTTPYQLFTGITQRVPRRYLN